MFPGFSYFFYGFSCFFIFSQVFRQYLGIYDYHSLLRNWEKLWALHNFCSNDAPKLKKMTIFEQNLIKISKLALKLLNLRINNTWCEALSENFWNHFDLGRAQNVDSKVLTHLCGKVVLTSNFMCKCESEMKNLTHAYNEFEQSNFLFADS